MPSSDLPPYAKQTLRALPSLLISVTHLELTYAHGNLGIGFGGQTLLGQSPYGARRST